MAEQSAALGLNALYTVDAFTRAIDDLLAEAN